MTVEESKNGVRVMRDTVILYTLRPGDKWCLYGDIIIIANPEFPPFILHSSGRMEEIKC